MLEWDKWERGRIKGEGKGDESGLNRVWCDMTG